MLKYLKSSDLGLVTNDRLQVPELFEYDRYFYYSLPLVSDIIR